VAHARHEAPERAAAAGALDAVAPVDGEADAAQDEATGCGGDEPADERSRGPVERLREVGH
jgi:hypothetical protein